VVLASRLIKNHCGKVLSSTLLQVVSKCGSFGTAPQGDRERQNCDGQLGSPSPYRAQSVGLMGESSPRRWSFRNEAIAAKNRVIPKWNTWHEPQIFFEKPTEHQYATCVASAAVEAHANRIG
jgi:hypothetical protein